MRSDPLLQVHPPVPWWLTRPGRAALGGLLLFALGFALHIARPLVLPLVLSFLLAVVLSPAVRGLRTLRLPSPLAAALVVAVFTGATGAGVYTLADPATGWIERAPEAIGLLERRLRTVKASVLEARQAADKVEEIARVDGDPPPREVTVKEPSLATRLVAAMPVALLYAAEVVILLYFLLAYEGEFLRKAVTIPGRLRGKIRVVRITKEIEREISNYLLTISWINAGLGAATAMAMFLLGMPNPLLWGALAAVLNYVPYLGSAVTLVGLSLVALLTFESLSRAALVPIAFLVLATIEGQFVTPTIVGRRMSLSPPAIVIALMAGAWIWGVVGLLLAVPLMAMVKIYCAHSEELSPIAELLARD